MPVHLHAHSTIIKGFSGPLTTYEAVLPVILQSHYHYYVQKSQKVKYKKIWLPTYRQTYRHNYKYIHTCRCTCTIAERHALQPSCLKTSVGLIGSFLVSIELCACLQYTEQNSHRGPRSFSLCEYEREIRGRGSKADMKTTTWSRFTRAEEQLLTRAVIVQKNQTLLWMHM